MPRKNKIVGGVLGAVCIAVVMLLICGGACEKRGSDRVHESAGIVLHGCGTKAAWIENKGDVAVKVERIIHHRCPEPVWIKYLQPGERLELGHLAYYEGLNINDTQGWLSGRCIE